MLINDHPLTILLSRKEAAHFLGVKENTLAVWQTTKRYALPCVKVGRLVKYRISDLQRFIEKRTTNPDHDGERVQ